MSFVFTLTSYTVFSVAHILHQLCSYLLCFVPCRWRSTLFTPLFINLFKRDGVDSNDNLHSASPAYHELICLELIFDNVYERFG